MIVNQLDLDIAVAEGMISRDQALQLRDLSKRAQAGGDEILDFSQDTRDEPFRLLRGFRDVFIAIGAAIFVIGLTATALSQTLLSGWLNHESAQLGGPSLWNIAITFALCLVALALAEFVTRRQRLPLASLVVSLAFAAWSAAFAAAVAAQFMEPAQLYDPLAFRANQSNLGYAAIGGAIAGSALFYWRYRLPFALFPLAGSLFGLSLLLMTQHLGPDLLRDHARTVIGLWGIAIFLVAMWFDTKDRLRVTRFSECAFWLHLFAAPILVHSALVPGELSEPSAAVILGTMALLSVIAVLIDRRALLVSGLSYLSIAIAHIVYTSNLFGDQAFAVTALILGGVVLTLGLGWTAIRGVVLALLPSKALKAWLPPVAP